MRALASTRLRIFLICWLLYSLHFATNIVREHYPAFALVEQGNFQVDRYEGFHSDIFEHTDGHHYVCNNVLPSVITAVPLLIFDPILDRLEDHSRSKLDSNATPVETDYETKHPNRRAFFRRVREEALDLRFGASAGITSAFLMAPLCAWIALWMYGLFREQKIERGRALGLTLVFAFGTPVFYRSVHLSHNVFLMHAVFAAFLALWNRTAPGEDVGLRRRLLAGFLAGVAFTLDYAGAIPALFLGIYLIVSRQRGSNWARAIRESIPFALASLPGLAFLLWSQASQFGDALKPAQFHMPFVNFTDQGLRGLSEPRVGTFLKNLFSPSWGLVPFAPILVLALWPHRGVKPTGQPSKAPTAELGRLERNWIWISSLGFLIFCAANQYALMQFNTGFRYLMPLVPFLFLLAARSLARMPSKAFLAVAALAIAHTWVLTMTREVNDTENDLRLLAIEQSVEPHELPGYWNQMLTETPVPMSYRRLLHEGPQLPWAHVLGSTPLGRNTPIGHPLTAAGLLALTLLACLGLWRWGETQRKQLPGPP